MVSGGSMAAIDVPPFCTAQGDRAVLRDLNTLGMRRAGLAREVISEIKAAYKTLFLSGLRLEEACAALKDFLHFTGRWDESLALSRRAEAKAVAADDHEMAGWRAYDAGFVHGLREQAEAVLAAPTARRRTGSPPRREPASGWWPSPCEVSVTGCRETTVPPSTRTERFSACGAPCPSSVLTSPSP
jgi:hypothetical protein